MTPITCVVALGSSVQSGGPSGPATKSVPTRGPPSPLTLLLPHRYARNLLVATRLVDTLAMLNRQCCSRGTLTQGAKIGTTSVTELFRPNRKPLLSELNRQYTVVAFFLAVNKLNAFPGGCWLYTLRVRQLRMTRLAKHRTWLGIGHRLLTMDLVYLRISALGLVVRLTSTQPQFLPSRPVLGVPLPLPRNVLKWVVTFVPRGTLVTFLLSENVW